MYAQYPVALRTKRGGAFEVVQALVFKSSVLERILP